MIKIEEKRRRPKADFGSDLPVKVERARKPDRRFDDIIETNGLGDKKTKPIAKRWLSRIATELQTSRKLQALSPTRPDAIYTLRVVATLLTQILTVLNGLPEKSASELERYLDKDCLSRNCKSGILASFGAAAILDEISTAASAANHRLQALAPPASRCLALDELFRLSRPASQKLLNLPIASAMLLMKLERYAPIVLQPNGSCSRMEIIKSILTRLSSFCEIGCRVGGMRKGPAQDTAQYRAVEQLAEFYTEMTNLPATHTRDVAGYYAGEVQSAFGKLVMAFMIIADPDPINRRGLDTALEHIAWPQRHTQTEARIAEQRRARDARIRALFDEYALVAN